MNQNVHIYILIYLIWDIQKNLLILMLGLHININIILKENTIIHFSRILKATLVYISKVLNLKEINICLTIKANKLNLIQWSKIGILKIKKKNSFELKMYIIPRNIIYKSIFFY